MTRHAQDGSDSSLCRKGSAPPWTAAIDELPESEGWLLEIESDQLYLTFQLMEIAALDRAVSLLNTTLAKEIPPSRRDFVLERDEVALGHFNQTAVHLLRDNEDFPRCFLIVGARSRSVLRVSLDEDAIRALAEALAQARAALAP